MKGLSFEKTITTITTDYGEFEYCGYFFSASDDENILAAVKKPLGNPTLVRMQSACYSGEVFRSHDCDCHAQLTTSLTKISVEGGVLLYLLKDGRGAGLRAKLKALSLWREKGVDTADAYTSMGLPLDPRDYARAALVLRDIGVGAARLLTNNPRKISGLEEFGIPVVREALEFSAERNSEAYSYLRTKSRKLGHLLTQFKRDR